MKPEVYIEADNKVTIVPLPFGNTEDGGWLVKVETKVWDDGTKSEQTLCQSYIFVDWSRLLQFLEDELF